MIRLTGLVLTALFVLSIFYFQFSGNFYTTYLASGAPDFSNMIYLIVSLVFIVLIVGFYFVWRLTV